MNPSKLPEETRNNLIVAFKRRLEEIIEAVTKSKDISKDFYLVAVDIQNNTEAFQDDIIMQTATWTVEDLDDKGFFTEDTNTSEKEVNELLLNNLKNAYEVINEEVNGK